MRRIINQKRLRTWEETSGICCLLAGFLAPLLGCLLTVIEWIVGAPGHPWIHITATALFIVAIPLILFAGFCLDWAEQGQKRQKRHEAHRGAADLAQTEIVATILGVAPVTPAARHAHQKPSNVPGFDFLERDKTHPETGVRLTP